MFGFGKGKDLQSVLNEKKVIKIKGINFVIKKIDAISYLDGSRVMMQMYDTYKSGKSDKDQLKMADKKIKELFAEVIVAGTVSPKFVFKEEEEGVYVFDLFKDMDIVNNLYEEIVGLTYGKKKLNTSLEKS